MTETQKEENSLLYKICLSLEPHRSFLAVGPKVIPLNYIINTQKAGTIIVMFILMLYYNNFSLGAWLYLSLHGTYGIVWILKDMIFPDKSFQAKVTIPAAVITGGLLLFYWVIGYLMMCGEGEQNPSPRKIFGCFSTFTIGLFLMVCTDLQKFITLKLKKGLIDEYFLAKNRNTNYLGEILVYLSFAMCTNKLIGYVILICIWVTVFGSRIYLKEISLMKKEGYKRYKNNSYLILFKFVDNDYVNLAIYGVMIAFIIACYII